MNMNYGQGAISAGADAAMSHEQIRGRVGPIPAKLDRPQSEIESSMGDLANVIGDLSMHVDNLRARLAPVLMPTGGEAQGAKSNVAPARSMMANAIEAQTDRVRELRTNVMDLLQRLAV